VGIGTDARTAGDKVGVRVGEGDRGRVVCSGCENIERLADRDTSEARRCLDAVERRCPLIVIVVFAEVMRARGTESASAAMKKERNDCSVPVVRVLRLVGFGG